MNPLRPLFDKNRAWSEAIRQRDPEFFAKLSRQQLPEYLWIGCSDSRVPANQIVGLLPGEIFVHRNVANVVVHTDPNCLSVAQFAVDVLKVRHIIVCGHYGCGGVRAALRGDRLGLIDNWLRHVQDVRDKHSGLLDALDHEVERTDRLCELNVLEQVLNVCQTSIVRDAWLRGQELTVHSWIYGLHDGLIRDLGMAVGSWKEVEKAHGRAVAALSRSTRASGSTPDDHGVGQGGGTPSSGPKGKGSAKQRPAPIAKGKGAAKALPTAKTKSKHALGLMPTLLPPLPLPLPLLRPRDRS